MRNLKEEREERRHYGKTRRKSGAEDEKRQDYSDIIEGKNVYSSGKREKKKVRMQIFYIHSSFPIILGVQRENQDDKSKDLIKNSKIHTVNITKKKMRRGRKTKKKKK